MRRFKLVLRSLSLVVCLWSYLGVQGFLFHQQLHPSPGVLASRLLTPSRLGLYNAAAEHGLGATTASAHSSERESFTVTLGADNFGDIMGGCETHVMLGGSFTPMERVVLTANGNLQRIMSAYYGSPVTVQVKKCQKVENSSMLYDREVDLVSSGRVFCTAVGKIQLLDGSCVDAVESKKIGVGQLFRYLGALPRFVLHEAGRKEGGILWRRYSLSCDQLTCEFIETFAPDFWATD